MAFWNWFSKKKEEDYETILSSLASDISKRQQKLSEIRLRERRATLLTTLYTLAAWLVYVSLWYFNYLPTHEGKGKGMRRVVLGVPVGVGPVVILFVRRIVQIWYQRKGDAEEKTLQNLRKTQRLKVEEIKKKTNYQSTHDLLRRYDESTASSPSPFSAGPTPARPQAQKPQQPKGQGVGAGMVQGAGSVPQTPMRPVVQMQNGKLVMGTPMTPVMPGGRMYVPTPQVPQHPPKKHWYDKLADALLGDDDSVPASSKYALICEKCFAHNGLVGEREREGIQYTCPKCGHFNPSIQSRLAAAAASKKTPSSKLASASAAPSPISPSTSHLSPISHSSHNSNASPISASSRESSASPSGVRRRAGKGNAGKGLAGKRGGESDDEGAEAEESLMQIDEEESD